jgi:Tol biopolymer transport system component
VDHCWHRGCRTVTILATLFAAMAGPPAAEATFPGGNGRIAFTSERAGNPEIYSMDPNGFSATRLTFLASDDRSPAWNQAGTDIAFASNRGADSLGDFEIFRMLASGASPSPLTSNLVEDGSPAWAPSGTQLVVEREELGDTELVTLAADGSGASTPLTGPISTLTGAVEPDWVANGSRIAFAAFPTGATKRDLFTIDPNGTGLTNVTNTPALDEREPSWSPDSAQLAYARSSGSDYEIRRIGANGTGDAPVANNHGIDDRQPAWSPTGREIAYVTRVSDDQEIAVIAVDGSSGLRLTRSEGPDTEPDWQRVSPTACNDGLDNDGDARIDFPNDPGCMSRSDNDEFNPPPPACNDDIDNDGDTKVDYPDDPGCTSLTDNDESNPACSDGVDNDGDTFTDYPADPGCTSATDNDEVNAPSGTFVRPKSAPLVMVPLVPAFDACGSPNRTHGPPLAFPSCNPPIASSTAVTIGTPDSNGAASNSVGSLMLKAVAGAPGPPDESDVIVTGSITDVRCMPSTSACGNANTIAGPDYTGALQATATMRITDRWNAAVAGGGSDAATVVDIPFPFAFGCAGTPSTAIGATCTSNASVNAIVPSAIRDGKRSVLELGQIVVFDGGPDGSSPTAPNTEFLRQGVFVP